MELFKADKDKTLIFNFVSLSLGLILGFCICILYAHQVVFPVSLTMTLSFVFLGLSFLYARYQHFPFLISFALCIFFLPFIHILEYLLNEDIVVQDLVWGLMPNIYNKDINVISRLSTVGCIGVIGLFFGIVFFQIINVRKKNLALEFGIFPYSLKWGWFSVIGFFAFFLSLMNTPLRSIFEGAYAFSDSIAFVNKINFNGAWQLSYVFLLLLHLDFLLNPKGRVKVLKAFIVAVLFFIIVFWFQLMRGDRECFGLIVAMAVMFFVNTEKGLKLSKFKLCLAGSILFVFVLLFQYVGLIRSTLYTGEIPAFKINTDMFVGTWTSALLTPLSVVGDMYYDSMELQKGKTFLDIFLSVPPGALTNAFGVERAIEATHGPAWQMRFGIGGTHAIVVPMMNFGICGVLFVSMLYGIFFSWVESLIDSFHMFGRLLYGALFIGLPIWFWYGELSGIRAVMAAFIVYVFYVMVVDKINKEDI